MGRRAGILLGAGMLLACSAVGLAAQKRVHRVVAYDAGHSSPEELWIQATESRWQEDGPVALLHDLRRMEDLDWRAHKRHSGLTVEGLHLRWVRKADLPDLFELLDSAEPCASVRSSLSSFDDSGGSTVGHEAGLLIDAYRTGRYPNFLDSTREHVGNDELRAWWLETGSKEKDRWDR